MKLGDCVMTNKYGDGYICAINSDMRFKNRFQIKLSRIIEHGKNAYGVPLWFSEKEFKIISNEDAMLYKLEGV